MASSDSERHVHDVAGDTDSAKKADGHQWLRLGRRRGKEDIRRYIAVHGKILAQPCPSSHHTPCNAEGHNSGQQTTVHRLWAGSKEERGGRTKAPASQYTKGVRKKAVFSGVDQSGKENSHGGLESTTAHNSFTVSGMQCELLESGTAGTEEAKLTRDVRKTAATRPRRNKRSLSTHPSTSPPPVAMDTRGGTGGDWLSSRSPKRPSAKRRPLVTINTDRYTSQGGLLPNTKRKRLSSGERNQACEGGESENEGRTDSVQERSTALLLPAHTEGASCGSTDMVSHCHPLPGPEHTTSASLPDSLRSSDLSWLDAGLPSEYRLSSLHSAELLCDTNELLEELSGCEKIILLTDDQPSHPD